MRLVTDAPGDCEIAGKAREALERVLAKQPRALLIVYEAPDEDGWEPVPAANCVARGLVSVAVQLDLGDDFPDED